MKNIDQYYNIMEWDSNFFDLGVAKFIPKKLEKEDFKKILESMKNKGVHLVYCIIHPHDQKTQQLVQSFGGYLVDNKTTFVKKVYQDEMDFPSFTNFEITEYPHNISNSIMDNLAVQSGVYSRFKIDPKITIEKFTELYKLWISNSVSKKIADIVFVAKKDEEIVGMITLKKKGDQGEIGLIAVQPHVRGMGIGKALIQKSLSWFQLEKCKYVYVATQQNNVNAVKLYKNSGFHIEKIESFYHIWLNE